MNKTKFILLLIIAFLVSVAVGCEKTPVGSSVVKPWEPTAFSLDIDRLPPNYLGLDPVKFYIMFKSKVENIKKGEFETSKEFAKRTANKDLLLSPTRPIYMRFASPIFIWDTISNMMRMPKLTVSITHASRRIPTWLNP